MFGGKYDNILKVNLGEETGVQADAGVNKRTKSQVEFGNNSQDDDDRVLQATSKNSLQT